MDNSRTIKFRAWHTRQGKMYSAKKLGKDQLTLSVDGRGFINVSGESTALSVVYGDKMIPLEYTGLKDKNGEEIYEGDIVTITTLNIFKKGTGRYKKDDRGTKICVERGEIDRENCRTEKGVVEYFPYICKFLIAQRQYLGLLTNQWNNVIEINPSSDSVEFEIIGNIYENKELMEEWNYGTSLF